MDKSKRESIEFSPDAISVRTDPKGSGEVSEPGDGTRKVWPRAGDPQGAEINLPPRTTRRLSLFVLRFPPVILVGDVSTRFSAHVCGKCWRRNGPSSVRGRPC